MPADIVDLELFQSSLARRGVPSYIDNEENVFHYNANKHVKTKKDVNKCICKVRKYERRKLL